MNGTSCIVRRLRLRAPSESAAHRAVVLFEDALRTASLPEAAGRMVIVRRLALGRIDSRVAPQMIALELERAFERVTPQSVHGGDVGAAAAPAVWFRDALEAHTRLALTLLAGNLARDWYWKLAVRTWEPEMPLPQALRTIMLSLARLPEARTALPQWTAAIVGAGHAGRLIAALQAEDIPRLARAAAPRVGATAGASRPPNEAQLVGAGASVEGFRGSAHSTVYSPGSRNRPRQIEEGSGDIWQRPAVDETQAGSGLPRVSSEPGRIPAVSVPKEAAPDREAIRASTADVNRVADAESGTATMPLSTCVSPDSATRAGGLLFLLPVLQRLGYPEWLEDAPGWVEWDIAKRVLAAVLARLRIAPEDPAWALAGSFCPTRAAPRRFVAPARWQHGLARSGGSLRVAQLGSTHTLWDASGRLLLGAWTGRCPRALAAAWRRAASHSASRAEHDRIALATSAWIVAMRRWLRRSARIGLADLVLRPAILSLTPTHADLHFEMRASELRVRRAGLDFNPGWVPWFGRVVTFHYQ